MVQRQWHLGNGIPQHAYLIESPVPIWTACTCLIHSCHPRIALHCLPKDSLHLFLMLEVLFPVSHCFLCLDLLFFTLLLVNTSFSSVLGNFAWAISILRLCISTNIFIYLL